MERLRWTDEMIDLRMAAMDEKFDRLFDELHAFRENFRAELAAVRGNLSAFQRQVFGVVAAFAVGLLGLLGALVAAQL